MKNKAIIRQNMIKKLKNFDLLEKRHQTEMILSNLTASKTWKSAKKIALYLPQDFEFDLSALFNENDKIIVVPKTLPERKMIFVRFDEKDLVRTKFGILEPTSNVAEIPDLIVVPGLAWNSSNHRIGFGGGYYDRYLANFSGKTVSLAYDFQLQDFEAENHDIKVGEIFSEYE